MDSIKDYLKKLEIKNDFLYKKLSDVLVTKVVYYYNNTNNFQQNPNTLCKKTMIV